MRMKLKNQVGINYEKRAKFIDNESKFQHKTSNVGRKYEVYFEITILQES